MRIHCLSCSEALRRLCNSSPQHRDLTTEHLSRMKMYLIRFFCWLDIYKLRKRLGKKSQISVFWIWLSVAAEAANSWDNMKILWGKRLCLTSFSTNFLINHGADTLSSSPHQGDPAGHMRQGRDESRWEKYESLQGLIRIVINSLGEKLLLLSTA